MRPQGPTFQLLGPDFFGKPEKNTILRTLVSVGVSGIQLAANSDPQTPAGLNSPDGSLGGLIMPLGMSLDRDGTLYLLPPGGVLIKRFDPRTKSFVILPSVGGEGSEARQFRDAANIAIAGRDLYVADRGNHRVQVLALGTLVLRQVWQVNAEDVTAQRDTAYVLDRTHGRVFKNRAGTDILEQVLEEFSSAGKWTRIAVDREGRIYLLDAAPPRLDVFDPSGRKLDPVREAGDIRDRFPQPPIRLDHKGRFCLPEDLMRECSRAAPARAPSIAAPLALCARSGQIFDRHGKPAHVTLGEPAGPKLYQTGGPRDAAVWISTALDSKIYRCPWHRIRLHAPDLPSGSSMVISTYTDAGPPNPADILNLPDDQWRTRYRIAGAMQEAGPSAQDHEFLVQSPEGRYLWLRIELVGDGYSTPVIDQIQVYYPRESYLSYLPAVYSSDDESRRFLDQFLSVFQTEWDDLEQRIARVAKYFDPKAVPSGPFMDYLAAWLALPLEATWSEEKKRRLLEAAPKIYPKIGTPEGVREYLRIYLQNITDAVSEQQDAFPQVVEGFRERDHLMLTIPGMGMLGQMGHGAALWSPSVVGRIQLGVYSTEGEAKLVSTGDPEHDIFDEYAHRFRVFVPSAWVTDAADERMIRRALDTAKPAHAIYDLYLVEPRFRIGLQSTIGLDTIIGDYPTARLGCLNDPDLPPSRAPRGLLGIDTILVAADIEPPALHLAPAVRVGLDTILN